MRLVFVNHAHPHTKHISGVRLWRFARELALLGHQVVQVTAPLEASAHVASDDLAARLSRHDWQQPLHAAVPPSPRRLLDLIRTGKMPALARRAGTAYALAARGGVFYDWTDAAASLVPALRVFRPELVWATFGNTSNVSLGASFARSTGAALCVDIKDRPGTFIPTGLHRLTTRLFRRAAMTTVNSELHRAAAEALTGHAPTLIYSGVDDAFFAPPQLVPIRSVVPGVEQPLVVTLTGSVYDGDLLRGFLGALARVRETLSNRNQIRLVYAGGARDEVVAMWQQLGLGDWLESHPYLPVEELAGLCRRAWVNAYITSNGGFHHKLLELLSTGRPVLAFGGESDESLRMARMCGTRLHVPIDEQGVLAALYEESSQGGVPANGPPLAGHLGWAAQARVLESVFLNLGESG